MLVDRQGRAGRVDVGPGSRPGRSNGLLDQYCAGGTLVAFRVYVESGIEDLD